MYVDKQRVSAKSREQNERLTLALGPHTINVFINLWPKSGAVTLTLLAQSGMNYTIRSSGPILVTRDCATTAVWIDADGTSATDRVPAMLSIARRGTEFMVGSTYVSVPARSSDCGVAQ